MSLTERIKEITKENNELKKAHININNNFKKMKKEYDKILLNYKVLFDKHSEKNLIDILGFDTMYFQYKMLDLYYKYMSDRYIMIKNRLYGDFFSIRKKIIVYIEENCKDIEWRKDLIMKKKIPTYKKIDVLKDYDLKFINVLFEMIIHLIYRLMNKLNILKESLKKDEKIKGYGISIDNCILLKQKNIKNIETEIELNVSYIKEKCKKVKLMLKKMSEEMKKKLEETLSKITLPLELLELKEKLLPV